MIFNCTNHPIRLFLRRDVTFLEGCCYKLKDNNILPHKEYDPCGLVIREHKGELIITNNKNINNINKIVSNDIEANLIISRRTANTLNLKSDEEKRKYLIPHQMVKNETGEIIGCLKLVSLT